jgi:DUF971 family protein
MTVPISIFPANTCGSSPPPPRCAATVRAKRCCSWARRTWNIDRITPVGNYAVILHFDDGHNTGIYSWDVFYDLGKYHDRYWGEYLARLKEAGHKRKEPS